MGNSTGLIRTQILPKKNWKKMTGMETGPIHWKKIQDINFKKVSGDAHLGDKTLKKKTTGSNYYGSQGNG